jgi:RNA polymerase sigma factor (sigma-70 family)
MDRSLVIEQLPGLRRYARALTGDAWAADDLVQDTLERALTKQALYVETGPLIRWLNSIMQNLFIDRVRSRRRRERLDDLTHGPAQGRGAVPASQEDHRYLTELHALLRRLPRNGGDIIMAVGVHGLGYEHTAARLQVRGGTIRSRLSRSRAALLHASLMSAPDPRIASKGRRSRSRAAKGLQPALGLWDRPRPTGV